MSTINICGVWHGLTRVAFVNWHIVAKLVAAIQRGGSSSPDDSSFVRLGADLRVIPGHSPERHYFSPVAFQATWSAVKYESMRRVNERVPHVQCPPRLVVKVKSGGGSCQRWSGSPNCSPSGVRAWLPPATDHHASRPTGRTADQCTKWSARARDQSDVDDQRRSMFDEVQLTYALAKRGIRCGASRTDRLPVQGHQASRTVSEHSRMYPMHRRHMIIIMHNSSRFKAK